MIFIVVQPIHTSIESNRILRAVGVEGSTDIKPITYESYEAAQKVAETLPLGQVILEKDHKRYISVSDLEKIIKKAKKKKVQV